MNDDFDDDDDWDGGDDEEWAGVDDDEPVLVPCPHCGAQIYEEALQCPVCGEYVVHDTHPLSGRPAWYVVLGVVGLIITAIMLVLV